jgi:hypothetical protein
MEVYKLMTLTGKRLGNDHADRIIPEGAPSLDSVMAPLAIPILRTGPLWLVHESGMPTIPGDGNVPPGSF